jgi:hypothetical protein
MPRLPRIRTTGAWLLFIIAAETVFLLGWWLFQ